MALVANAGFDEVLVDPAAHQTVRFDGTRSQVDFPNALTLIEWSCRAVAGAPVAPVVFSTGNAVTGTLTPAFTGNFARPPYTVRLTLDDGSGPVFDEMLIKALGQVNKAQVTGNSIANNIP